MQRAMRTYVLRKEYGPTVRVARFSEMPSTLGGATETPMLWQDTYTTGTSTGGREVVFWGDGGQGAGPGLDGDPGGLAGAMR